MKWNEINRPASIFGRNFKNPQWVLQARFFPLVPPAVCNLEKEKKDSALYLIASRRSEPWKGCSRSINLMPWCAVPDPIFFWNLASYRYLSWKVDLQLRSRYEWPQPVERTDSYNVYPLLLNKLNWRMLLNPKCRMATNLSSECCRPVRTNQLSLNSNNIRTRRAVTWY